MHAYESQPTIEQLNQSIGRVIGAAIEVHSHFGPDLLESAYEQALAHEFDLRGVSYLRRHDVDVVYKKTRMRTRHRSESFVVPAL